MKFEKLILLVAVALMLGWGVGATSDPVKIGFVDIEQVLAVTESGKAARDELERKTREAQQRISPLVEQLQGLQKEFEAKKFVMSEEAARAMELDMVELKNRAEAKGKEEENQLKIDQQRLLGPLFEKLEAVINDVGRDNDFSVLFRIDAQSVVYKREALDVTDLVIKTFNRKG